MKDTDFEGEYKKTYHVRSDKPIESEHVKLYPQVRVGHCVMPDGSKTAEKITLQMMEPARFDKFAPYMEYDNQAGQKLPLKTVFENTGDMRMVSKFLKDHADLIDKAEAIKDNKILLETFERAITPGEAKSVITELLAVTKAKEASS